MGNSIGLVTEDAGLECLLHELHITFYFRWSQRNPCPQSWREKPDQNCVNLIMFRFQTLNFIQLTSYWCKWPKWRKKPKVTLFPCTIEPLRQLLPCWGLWFLPWQAGKFKGTVQHRSHVDIGVYAYVIWDATEKRRTGLLNPRTIGLLWVFWMFWRPFFLNFKFSGSVPRETINKIFWLSWFHSIFYLSRSNHVRKISAYIRSSFLRGRIVFRSVKTKSYV